MTTPHALLIDMDGTIVDSEPYWIASEYALVAEFGGSWSPEDAHSVVGFDLLDAAVELQTRGGVELEPTEIVERLLDSVIAMCAEELPWRPGARELLIEVRHVGVPCVLVTMSWRRLADAVLAEAPAGVFVGSVTGDGVVNGIDLGLLLGAWGPCAGPSCTGDLNRDGSVNGIDLGALLGAWD